MRRATYWYVTILAVAGISAATAVFVRYPEVSESSLRASVWFAGLVLLGNFASYGKRAGGAETVAYLPLLAAIAVAPTWQTVAFAGAVTLIAEVVARREVVKLTFNLSKAVLSTALGILTYHAIGAVALADAAAAPGFLVSMPAYLITAVVLLLSNSIPLALVVAISTGQPLRTTWRGAVFGTLAADLLAAPLAYLFGRVFMAFGGAGVAWLGLPLIGLRQLYSSNWQLKRTNEELLELMVAAIEARDPYTSGHSRRVAHYSRLIAAGMGLPSKKIDEVERAALLHDVGKIDEKYAPLLRKAGRLTAEEETIMQTHAARSAELVSKVSYLSSLVPLVRHHHEAWDGTGYPDGLAGERIPLASRIIAFADTIDAMTSERPYRAGLPSSVVRAEIVRCRGTQFDPTLTDQVVSADIWKVIFPSGEPVEKAASSLVLMPSGTRRPA